MNVQDIELDLSKERHGNPIVRIGQGDSGGTTIRATIWDNLTPASLSGASASFKMTLPDKRHYVDDGNCAVSGNVITYVVDEDKAAAAAGYTDDAYFSIELDGKVYSTSRFRVKVERDASDNTDPAASWSNGVKEFLEDAQTQLDTAIEDTQETLGTLVEQSVDDAVDELAESMSIVYSVTDNDLKIELIYGASSAQTA